MKRMLALGLVLCFLAVSFFFQTGNACAGEIDILLGKLVEKGVLTPGEAQSIKTETQEQVKKEIAQGKSISLPSWVQTIKLKGDFRLRYQHDQAKELAGNNQSPRDGQDRARIRARLGLEGKVNDKIKAGVGIATGSTTDPRSTNITLGSSSTKKSIVLDYAYATYSPWKWASFTGGKMQNPLWEPGDLIWDTDITPEGGAAALSAKLGSKTELFSNLGVFLIGEAAGDEADPTMYVLQGGLKQQLTDAVSAKIAASFYNFTGLVGKSLTASSGTNSTVNGGLKYNYKNFTPAFEISINEPFKAIGFNLPYFALFGEYVANVVKDVPGDDTGWMLGFKAGAQKVEKWKDWQFKFNYCKLGKDSILDILPDSDRYGGKTGIKGYEAGLDFGLGKNTWLGLDYYYNEYMKGNFGYPNSRPYQVVQVDWNVKF